MPSCLQACAQDTEIPNAAYRLFGFLHGELDFCAFRPLKLEWLGSRFGRSVSQLSRHLNLLVEKGYLEREPGGAQPYKYRIPLSCPLPKSAKLRSA
ncbi:MAG TPA: helix-turn-helix domain-containing protein [Gemmatimonadales bacterium]|nr:helix-turn-helix domain-containing protein [Gemmatimonadales bacterium]